MKTNEDAALEEFTFSVPYTADNEKFLKARGYERRNGDGAYEQKFLWVQPFKTWYWPCSGPTSVNLSIKKEVKEIFSLEYGIQV